MRQIEYNSQRDNFNFKGLFRGSCQCFSTTAWMLLSFFAPQKYFATDDDGLKAYVDDVCNLVGTKGIAEMIAQAEGLSTKNNLAYEWTVQRAAIAKWLWSVSVAGAPVCDINLDTGKGLLSWQDLPAVLEKSPVILGTTKMGGLSGGHIILVVDIAGDVLICHDPYGDATTNYTVQSGNYVRYPMAWIRPYTGETHVRALWWDRNGSIA